MTQIKERVQTLDDLKAALELSIANNTVHFDIDDLLYIELEDDSYIEIKHNSECEEVRGTTYYEDIDVTAVNYHEVVDKEVVEVVPLSIDLLEASALVNNYITEHEKGYEQGLLSANEPDYHDQSQYGFTNSDWLYGA